MNVRIFLAFVFLSFLSCSIQEPDARTDGTDSSPLFRAIIESPKDSQTRTFVDSQLHVLWNASDSISIFDKITASRKYCFAGQDGDPSGLFEIVSDGYSGDGVKLDSVYAVYPYSRATRMDGEGVIHHVLPSSQAYRQDSFGPGANVMVSVSEGNDLFFKNLCGYFAFSLFGEGVSVTEIRLKGNENEPLAGAVDIHASLRNNPAMTFVTDEAEREIVLSFDTPVTLGNSEDEPTVFWMVLPPTLFKQGITLTVFSPGNQSFEKVSTSPLTIKRNAVTRTMPLNVSPKPGPSWEKHPAVAPENRMSYMDLLEEGMLLGRLVFQYSSDGLLSRIESYLEVEDNAVVPDNVDTVSFSYPDTGIEICGSGVEKGCFQEKDVLIDGSPVPDYLLAWWRNEALNAHYNQFVTAGWASAKDENRTSSLHFGNWDFNIRYSAYGHPIQWTGDDSFDIRDFTWEGNNLALVERETAKDGRPAYRKYEYEYSSYDNLWTGVSLNALLFPEFFLEEPWILNDHILGVQTRKLPSLVHTTQMNTPLAPDPDTMECSYQFDEGGRVEEMTITMDGYAESVRFHYGNDTPTGITVLWDKQLVRQQIGQIVHQVAPPSSSYDRNHIARSVEVTSWYDDGTEMTENYDLGIESISCYGRLYRDDDWKMDQDSWTGISLRPVIRDSYVTNIGPGHDIKTFVLDYGSFSVMIDIQRDTSEDCYFPWYDGNGFHYEPFLMDLDLLSISITEDASFGNLSLNTLQLIQPVHCLIGEESLILPTNVLEYFIPLEDGFRPPIKE